MRILGLDYGQKRIGVAIADTEAPVAVPRGVFSAEDALSDIVALCRKENLELIILGLPLTMAGEEGEMARQARAFGDRLRRASGVPVEYVDERLSSKVSASDAGAAAAILQTWLDRSRKEIH